MRFLDEGESVEGYLAEAPLVVDRSVGSRLPWAVLQWAFGGEHCVALARKREDAEAFASGEISRDELDARNTIE